jgi:hypothetical protein
MDGYDNKIILIHDNCAFTHQIQNKEDTELLHHVDGVHKRPNKT